MHVWSGPRSRDPAAAPADDAAGLHHEPAAGVADCWGHGPAAGVADAGVADCWGRGPAAGAVDYWDRMLQWLVADAAVQQGRNASAVVVAAAGIVLE